MLPGLGTIVNGVVVVSVCCTRAMRIVRYPKTFAVMIWDLLGSIHDCLAFCCNELFFVLIVCYGIQYMNAIEYTFRSGFRDGDIRTND